MSISVAGKASYRETWAEVSLDAIYHNASIFKNSIAPKCKLMAVIKADGYGHGSVEAGETALEAGADYLGVAFLDEAIVLRKNGISASILVLGYTSPDAVQEAIQHDITLAVYTEEAITAIHSSAAKLDKKAKVHLKVDTGMGRIGVITKEDALSLAQQADRSEHIELEGIFTHFSSADEEETAPTIEQFEKFKAIFNYINQHQISIPIKHCCNSAGSMRFPEMHLDMVRVGISLYGLNPSEVVRSEAFPLKQALSFKTKVTMVKKVQQGDTLSYGRTFKADRETLIATIPVGYADGLSRQLSNRGSALVHNRRVQIVGRVCMDQTMLDVSNLEGVQIGDEVVLFGRAEDDAFISIDEVAELMGTINYEVVCLVMKRVPRVYVRNEKAVNFKNMLL
ncbi:alanine racemase [Mesobacillus harenae]|uniref:alanine racemase n=1 Tax=Mesobacillus harenae TaxID=2213203 RepID=UPI0030CDA054